MIEPTRWRHFPIEQGTVVVATDRPNPASTNSISVEAGPGIGWALDRPRVHFSVSNPETYFFMTLSPEQAVEVGLELIGRAAQATHLVERRA